MADAAHLTSAVSIDKPSIFEVIAQESLMTTIRPALKHAVRVLAENRPERFGWLARFYDEIYTILDFLVQSRYLRKNCASFAENFYGLQRVPVGEKPCSKLPGKSYWKSLFCLIPTANCTDPDLLSHHVLADMALCSLSGEIGRTNNIDPDLPAYYSVADVGLCSCWTQLKIEANNIQLLACKLMNVAISDFLCQLFALQVILPYIKEKLDKKFEDMRHLYNSSANKKGFSSLYGAFIAVYPYVHASWEATMLGYQTTYMFGKSNWHSPLLHLSGCKLNHSLEEDLWSSQQSSQISWKEASLVIRVQFVLKYLFNTTAIAVSTGLSVGVFFLQFLDWWYTNDSAATSLTALPIPEPPMKDMEEIRNKYGVCPICNRTRTNDTALSISGYVFCYPCIYDHVKKYSCCPITHYPARTEHLIRLYKDDA